MSIRTPDQPTEAGSEENQQQPLRADPVSSSAPSLPIQAAGGLSPIEAEDMAEEAVRAAAEGMPARRRGRSEAAIARDDARRTLILTGDIHKGVLKIALPSVATMLLQTTNGFLDSFFVGKLGPDALAAITVASSLMFALMSAAMAVSVGTSALVSRFVGENNIADAERATRQSLMLSLILSVVVGAVMWFVRIPLLNAMGLADRAHDMAEGYLRVTILGLPSLFLMLILNGAFRGIGDTVRPFWVTLGANVIHAGFNYLLIFGKAGFPKMGLPGGALALAISQAAATGLYLLFLRRSALVGVLHGHAPGAWRIDWDWGRRIARIGLPASAQQFIRVGSMLAFQSLLAHTGAGSDAVAALGVGLRSEAIAFMPGFGYSIAASAFVGQNLGARHIKRAQAGAWSATWQAIAVMSVMGLVFYTLAEPFARLFIQHMPGESPHQAAQVNETIRLAVTYLRIAAWSEPFLGLGMVLTGALQGAGETVSPTALTIITMVVVRLPLAWLLSSALGFGPSGAYWSMSISTILNGILVVFIFRQGRWRHKRV